MSSQVSSPPAAAMSPVRRPAFPWAEPSREQLWRLERGMLYAAHEAKTALTVIDVVLSMAQRSITNGRLPALTDLETARVALRRASAHLDGALAYGGVRPQSQEPVNLVEVVGTVADMVRVMARASAEGGQPVEIIERYAGPRCIVEGDRALLEAALLNLTFNSLQALGAQGGTVCLEQSCDGEAAQLSIRDTGPGFAEPSEHDPALPFHTTRNGGLGLGLPIAQAAIEALHGRLTLRNPDGGGAEALIRLPLAQPKPNGPSSRPGAGVAPDEVDQGPRPGHPPAP